MRVTIINHLEATHAQQIRADMHKDEKKQFTCLKRWGALRCWDLQKCWLPGSTADDPHTADWSRPAQHTHTSHVITGSLTWTGIMGRILVSRGYTSHVITGSLTRRGIMGCILVSREKNQTWHAVLHSISHPDCQKWTFEICGNMTMSAAILCLAVCISDVMSKAGKCGWSIKCQKPFSALCWKDGTWLHSEELKLNTKRVHLLYKWYIFCIDSASFV